MNLRDKKGLFWYLGLTFTLTWVPEIYVTRVLGWTFTSPTPNMALQILVLTLMFVPAISALITARFITREGKESLGLHWGQLAPYVWIWLTVPVAFIAIHALTWLLGLGQPDWSLHSLMELARQANPGAPMPSPHLVLAGMFAGTVLFSPFINSGAALGEELGWRGYMLPKLMPLGKTRAFLLSGVIWGLWHAPLILAGFNYPGHPWAGVAMMCLFTTLVGIPLGLLRLRYDSAILATVGHGVLNSQGYGIWKPLFPTINLLYGGPGGLVGALVWGALAAWAWRRIPEKSPSARMATP